MSPRPRPGPRGGRHPVGGGYVYPFIGDISTGRVDQGQDFAGTGVIVAIGKAKILKLGAPGWPEGGGVLYQLLDGPRKGQIIFQYEGVNPAKGLKPGMIVNRGTPIAKFRKGGSIEWGFADSAGVPLSHGEYYEGLETKWGKKAKGLLDQLLKAPAQVGDIEGAPGFIGSVGEELAKSPGEVFGEAGSDAGRAAGSLAGEIISGIFGEIHPEPLMLNIGLVGGGAFLIYYGAALMLGVKKPVGAPVKAAAGIAAAAPK